VEEAENILVRGAERREKARKRTRGPYRKAAKIPA